MVDLGVVPTAVGEGTVSTELRVERRHTQHTGVVHAGVMATMADHSMGAAAQTLARRGLLDPHRGVEDQPAARRRAASAWCARPTCSSPGA